MKKVVLEGYILVPENDLDTVERELENHTRLTLAEPGCITFKVTKDSLNPSRFNVYEEFIDQNAFDLHQARVKASHWGKVTHKVERRYTVSKS